MSTSAKEISSAATPITPAFSLSQLADLLAQHPLKNNPLFDLLRKTVKEKSYTQKELLALFTQLGLEKTKEALNEVNSRTGNTMAHILWKIYTPTCTHDDILVTLIKHGAVPNNKLWKEGGMSVNHAWHEVHNNGINPLMQAVAVASGFAKK